MLEVGYRVADGDQLPRVEAGQRVPGPPRGDAQGRQALMPGDRGIVDGPQTGEGLGGVMDTIGTAMGRPRPGPGRAGGGRRAWADWRTGWITPAFDFVAHQFYEVPMLAADPPAVPACPGPRATWRSARSLLVAGTAALFPRLGRHGRPWLAIFWVGYAIRATVWICGGNLPLVPGDSCHYLEVATSVYRGEGPVKHYVESFFTDYPRIRQGQGVLDDWATPLDAYVRAVAFRLAGIVPGQSLEATVGVAKACSFVLNLLTLPALYLFARRRFGAEVGAGVDGRAGRAAGARDLRRFRAPREPGRADRAPGGLDA